MTIAVLTAELVIEIGQVKVNEEPTSVNVYLFATLIILLSLAYYLLGHSAWFYLLRLGMQARVAIGNLIFKKSMKLSNAELQKTSSGQIINLLSNDCNRFNEFFELSQYTLTGLGELAIGCYFIGIKMGLLTMLVGLSAVAIVIPLQVVMGKWFRRFRKLASPLTDDRIGLMSEIVSSMKTIKMYCWEEHFNSSINEARKTEIGTVQKTQYLSGFNFALYAVIGKVTMLLTIATFTLVNGEKLTPSLVFLLMGLINQIRFMLNRFFPIGVLQIAETLVAARRIQVRLKPISLPFETTCSYKITFFHNFFKQP